MNIQTQLCGLIFLIVITVIGCTNKKIKTRSYRMVWRVLISAIVCLTLDAFSIYVIYRANGEYGLFEVCISKAYLISLLVIMEASFGYFEVEIESVYAGIKKSKVCLEYLLGAGILGIIVSEIKFYHNGSDLYTYGPCTTITYIIAFTIIVSIVLLLILQRKHINKDRRRIGLVWMGIWTGAALIQFLNSEYLFVGFAAVVGVGILFMKLENPEGYLDRETGVLNQQTMKIYIREKLEKKESVSMIVIRCKIADDSLTEEQKREVMRNIAEYLSADKKIDVFKNQEREFTLMFNSREEMEVCSKKLEERFKEEWIIGGKRLYVQIKIFEVPEYTVNDDYTIDTVRRFMNESVKEKDDVRYVLDSEWIERDNKKEHIAEKIMQAINEDRVVVYYQPIYSTVKKKIVSAEALVRIINTDGTLMMPGEFIPVAEQTGLINEIGIVVFKKACEFIKKNDLVSLGIEYIEINISTVQSTKIGFADKYIQIIKEIGVEPEMINLEITESAAVKSKDSLIENMDKLLKYGVTFSLDDFGTGYSNLNYILELPVQIVKFDREMTMAHFNSSKGNKLMNAAIGMIKTFGLNIVSEGVETLEQLTHLEKMNIDYIQGFYFSRPIPEMEFIQYVKGYN